MDCLILVLQFLMINNKKNKTNFFSNFHIFLNFILVEFDKNLIKYKGKFLEFFGLEA